MAESVNEIEATQRTASGKAYILLQTRFTDKKCHGNDGLRPVQWLPLPRAKLDPVLFFTNNKGLRKGKMVTLGRYLMASEVR